MTDRIYYTDPACCTFDAVVTRSFEHGGRPAVVLDRTAFYPTSGGQPFDTGRLADVRVVDVLDEGDEVVHVLSRPLADGMRVTGEVDLVRRFDHMQQHTGQHVLSAAFERLFENRTLSFHMGTGACTIDLERDSPAADTERAVSEANRAVWEDLPVSIRFVSQEEASRLPLRKEPARDGTLRLIEISGFDLSACGGTHVARTGSIGAIVVLGTERFRGGTRVTFACGRRAVTTFDLYRDAVAASVRVLSVLPAELPHAIERAQAEGRELRKTVAHLQRSLAAYEAVRMLADAATFENVRVVMAAVEGWDAAGLKAIASALTAHARVLTVLVSSSVPASIVVARSPDVDADASQVLRELVSRFGGRGGGTAALAQGGGLSAPPAEILGDARAIVTRR